jgi:uncharacterized membrane protein YkvI
MLPHPLEYARTSETRKNRGIRRRASPLDWMYLILVVACYVVQFAVHHDMTQTHRRQIDYWPWAHATCWSAATVIVSMALSLTGLKEVRRLGPTRYAGIVFLGALFSGILAVYSLADLEQYRRLFYDLFTMSKSWEYIAGS